MAQPEIEWSFDEAPAANEPAGAEAMPGTPPPRPRAGPRWWADPARRRRVFAVTAALLLVGALAGWALTRLGWQRVEQQLAEEVRYEDEASAAGDAGRVLSVWAETGPDIFGWRQMRERLAQAHLAAPLPAAHLRPLNAPPTVLTVTAPATNQFAVEVARAYRDSAGEVVTFTVTQHYRNVGGGLWERTPPDMTPLTPTTLVTGQRLSATVLVEELPWLAESLAAADLILVEACAAWGDRCGAGERLNLTFSADPLQWLDVPPPGRRDAALGPYPAVFDAAATTPAPGGELRLPALTLTGVPADAAARQALTRALAAHGLAYLAQTVTGRTQPTVPGRTQPELDYFVQALAARAEVRLGLAGPPTYTLRAQDFVPIELLWRQPLDQTPAAAPDEQARQLVVFTFLSQTLAAYPAATDGALLGSLDRVPDVRAWLSVTLGAAVGSRATEAWLERSRTLFAAAGWPEARLEGLAFICGGNSWVWRAGQTVALPFRLATNVDPFSPAPQLVSRDGRYLAELQPANEVPTAAATLHIVDLSDLTVRAWPFPRNVLLVGWTQQGALLYVEQLASEQMLMNYGGLKRFDPATGEHWRLALEPVAPYWISADSWDADGALVVMGLLFGLEEGERPPDEFRPWNTAPTLIAADGSRPARRLADQGFGFALSARGDWLAYGVPGPQTENEDNFELTTVEAVEVATLERRVLLTAAQAPRAAAEPPPEFLAPLRWSPDETWVLVLAGGSEAITRLLAVPRDGGEPRVLAEHPAGGYSLMYPLGFSADGTLLAVMTYEAEGPTVSMVNIEGAPEAAARPLRLVAQNASGAAWSPDGTLLAVAEPSGVRVLDPATGLEQWVRVGACEGVRWLG